MEDLLTRLSLYILSSFRWALVLSVSLSLLFGSIGMGFWFFVEEVDSDICTIRSDGVGLIPLHDQFGPDVYCDPKWGMVLIGILYYAILLFPAILLMGWISRAFYLFIREQRSSTF